jgi:hypothetical protein
MDAAPVLLEADRRPQDAATAIETSPAAARMAPDWIGATSAGLRIRAPP